MKNKDYMMIDISFVPMLVGGMTMLFSALFLVLKARLNFGMSMLLGILSMSWPGLIILPLLSKDINRNEQIVTSLFPVASERLKNRVVSNQWTPAAGRIFAPARSREFAPYTGGGVCDVCNQPLSGRQAWIVPNDVFYGSYQYREHLKNSLRMMGMSPTDADVERMRMMDNSPGSAVCQNCIHMFI